MIAAARAIENRIGKTGAKTAIVLGSGLGDFAASVEGSVRIPFAEIEGFPLSSVSGHAGQVVFGTIAGRPVILLAGRVHYYETGDARAMRTPIAALTELGIENLILTNSAGSTRPDLGPGSVMRISDHINYSGLNPLIGEEGDHRFVGMTSAYDAGLAKAMDEAAIAAGVDLARGIYMWFSGPSFETPAEVRMARLLGADAVGMSTVPEVIMARFFGLRIAAASVVTNFGAGMTGGELSHEETKEMAPIGGRRLGAILTRMIGSGL